MIYALVLLVVCLVLLWTRMDPGEAATDLQQYQLQTWLDVSRYETQQVMSKLGTPLSTLNFTGVQPSKNASQLNSFIPYQLNQQIGDIWLPDRDGVYYRNISSILHGMYLKGPQMASQSMDLSKFNETLDSPVPLELDDANKIQVNIVQGTRLGSAAVVRASCYLGAEVVTMHGFYLDTGHFITATKSLKFSGIKALPFISPAQRGLEDVQKLIQQLISNDTREHTYADFQERLEQAGYCEWVMYGRSKPSTTLSQQELEAIEQELENPIGRPTQPAPSVYLEAVLYSPDCGQSLHIKTDGERLEQFKIRFRHSLVMLLGLFIALYSLTVVQVQQTSSPTSTFRISFWSVALTTLPDGLVCMVCMVSTFERAFALQLMAIVVVVFCFITTVQLDYLVSIFHSQLGEGGSSADYTLVQVSAMVNSRMYISIVVLCMVLLSSYGYNDRNRKIVEWAILLVLYSNWWPQVYRSARRGFSKPFLLKYVYGSSILRVAPIMYMCFYPRNVGYHRYDPELGWTLLAWQWMQVMLITSQYYLGGEFLFPKFLVMDSHDYHPILNTDLEALLHTSELPIQQGEEQGYKQVDCPICMNPVRLVLDSNSAASMLARRKYMVTPCRHVFHTQCLQEWMDRKLECPVCRTALPST